jgi:pimeloyl-ACP methyl ester carboxylesterase
MRLLSKRHIKCLVNTSGGIDMLNGSVGKLARVLGRTLGLTGLCLALIAGVHYSAFGVQVQTEPDSPDGLSGLAWVPCPLTVAPFVRCGTIEVPENRDAATGGRMITLSFAVVAAAGEPAETPVAFLTGGPGFSAFASLRMLPKMAIHRNRDIVVLEPRGYGYSDPWLGCDSVDELPECHAAALAAGIDVEQYTTSASVEDYEDLRAALGYARWNLFGVSYGTYWASLYSRMYPDSLRAIVMDSPYPLNAGYDWNRVAVLNGFEQVFNACKADKDCNAAYPDLRARFIRALRRLKAQPAIVDGTPLDHISAFAPIFGALYISTSLSRTPRLIDALAREDYDLFGKLAAQSPFDFPEGIDYRKTRSHGLNASVMCMEDIFFPASTETRVALSAPWPSDIIELITPEGWDYDRRCGGWPVGKVDPSINEPVANDIPTLVLVGAYDPVTPPEFAQAMMLHLSNATLAVDPATAHALFADDNVCIHEMAVRFLNQPFNKLDISCLMKTKPVSWDLPE